MSDARRFATDRIGLLLETTTSPGVEIPALFELLVESVDVASSKVTGHSVHDRDVAEISMSWICAVSNTGLRQSQGKGRRDRDLRRLSETMRAGPVADAVIDWQHHTEQGAVGVSCWFYWWGDRPHLRVEWLWADHDQNGLAAEMENAAVAVAKEMAGACPVVFLHLTDDMRANRPALETLHGRMVPTCQPPQGTLRSYSWVTHLSSDQVDAVGGIRGLRSSGAFFQVIPVDGGGVLLRATEHLPDYSGPKVRAVFEALDAVIPNGPEKFKRLGARLAWADGTAGPLEEPDGNRLMATHRRG